ncbi:MAG: hypothetical protein EYC69_13585 [Bacteroidetes bacterium]|nr:MAG: hypothetical protein EYC69_13585 [Bacteroidota bacterium]
MKAVSAIFLLIISNFFMVFAWYGHLQFKKWNIFQGKSIFYIILLSWLLAFFEYVFQVPGNRIGHQSNGGPFDLFQLKVIQEVITLVVFSFCAIYIFKTDKFHWNYLVAFFFLILAVFFVFKKW